MPQIELLEELRIAVGATYISDLRDVSLREDLKKAIAGLPADSHRAKCWQSLADYLLIPRPQGEPAEIKEKILELL